MKQKHNGHGQHALHYLGDVRNGDVSDRDAVEDRPELDGMAVDGRQGGPRGAGYGSRSEDGVA